MRAKGRGQGPGLPGSLRLASETRGDVHMCAGVSNLTAYGDVGRRVARGKAGTMVGFQPDILWA